MTQHIFEAYSADFESRTKERTEGLYTVGSFPEGHAVNAHEVSAGVVYKDANDRHRLPDEARAGKLVATKG